MNTPAPEIGTFEFCFPNLDTLVRVETTDDGVVIRTSRDTFTESRKQGFVLELAAEGFIGDAWRWMPAAVRGAPRGVRWLVDTACFAPDRKVIAHTRRFMILLLMSAAALWLLMLGWLWLKSAG